ncbi:hypothetical protein ACWDZ4_22050 [Streptomyces sp. NPDC003016]
MISKRILSSLFIGGATSGPTIKIPLYAFGSDWIANLLTDAHHRNANVQVLVDHTSIETDGWMGKSGEPVKNKPGAAFAEVPPAGTTYGTSWFRVRTENQPCLVSAATVSALVVGQFLVVCGRVVCSGWRGLGVVACGAGATSAGRARRVVADSG